MNERRYKTADEIMEDWERYTEWHEIAKEISTNSENYYRIIEQLEKDWETKERK